MMMLLQFCCCSCCFAIDDYDYDVDVDDGGDVDWISFTFDIFCSWLWFDKHHCIWHFWSPSTTWIKLELNRWCCFYKKILVVVYFPNGDGQTPTSAWSVCSNIRQHRQDLRLHILLIILTSHHLCKNTALSARFSGMTCFCPAVFCVFHIRLDYKILPTSTKPDIPSRSFEKSSCLVWS